MDASAGATSNGNGHAVPDPVSLPSAVGPEGAPVVPAPAAAAAGAPAGADPARDPKTGRIKPGHSLNPNGRQPGIPNRNTQLNKGFEAFKAQPELCKKALSKYGIRIRGMKAEALLVTLAFARAIVDGDVALLEWCGERAYVKLTPEAAGIVINNNPQAHAGAQANPTVNYGNARQLLADEAGRELLARCAERLASGGLDTGAPRHVRQ